MTSEGLVLAIAGGAALVAFWIDARWSSAAPQRLGARVLHVGAALVVAQYLAPEMMAAILPPGRSIPLELTALFAVFLPSLVYVFLSAIWIFKLLHGVLQPYR